MISFIHLYCSLNVRRNAKENSQPNNQSHSKPKVVPLYWIPLIIPPLSQVLRLRLVKCLLQYDKTIVPENEFADLSFYSLQSTFACCFAINTIPKFLQSLLFRNHLETVVSRRGRSRASVRRVSSTKPGGKRGLGSSQLSISWTTNGTPYLSRFIFRN
jgi:hypothetical protein